MATEKMYELAFRFRDTNLWQKLYDDEMFAVSLTDGKIGYCSVMGMTGDHYALALYVGEEGYKSYRLLLDAEFSLLDDVVLGALMREQRCLQCSFENKADLSEEELTEVQRYTMTHEPSPQGKNAFPQFTKYRPGRCPWCFDSPLDEQRICDALSAAIALGKLLRRCSKEELGLHSLRDGIQVIPLLAFADGCWFVRFTALPDAGISYPEPELINEVAAARIKRKLKNGIWECGTVRLPNAIHGEDQGEAPCFPLALICAEQDTGLVQQFIVTDGENAAEMMNRFAEQLLELETVPKKIICGDDRCFSVLKDLCAKTGIRLARANALKVLGQVMRDLLENMAEDESTEPSTVHLNALFDALMQMLDSELMALPQEVCSMLLNLAEKGTLPSALSSRVRSLFCRKKHGVSQ